MGVTAYLTKPPRSSDLEAMLLGVLSSRPQEVGAGPSPLLTRYSLATETGPKNLRILLAEDNAINQKIARCLLEKHGHSVTLATNGRQSKTKISLQQLLNCLDGVASGEGIITIATANEPTALDPAILPQARPL